MAAKTAKQQLPKTVPSANLTASIQVSLPQMLDLALGTPEVGAVNLNLLHNFLHVVLHQINLRTTKVEYRGDDADRIKSMVASSKAGPSLHLHEYSITDGSGKVKQRIHSTDNITVNVDIYTEADAKAKTDKGGTSAPSTTKEAKSKPELDTESGTKKIKGIKQQISGGVEGEYESVIFVESVLDGATPTALGFKQLESAVQRLQQQFQALEELAANPELIEKVRGNNTDPLTDMWQIININKRLDASEQGINKLTSMLQDLIKSDKIEIQGGPDLSSNLTEIDKRLADVEANVALLFVEDSSSPRKIQETLEGGKTDAASEHEETANSRTDEKDIIVEGLTDNKPNSQVTTTNKSEASGGSKGEEEGSGGGATSIKKSVSKSNKVSKRPSFTVDLKEIRGEVENLKSSITQVRKDILELKSKIDEQPKNEDKNKETSSAKEDKEESSKQGITPAGEKAAIVQEEKSQPSGTTGTENEISEKMNHPQTEKNVETLYLGGIQELSNRVQELEKDVSRLMETVNAPINGGDSNGGQVHEIHSKIQNIQTDIENLKQMTAKILEDKKHMDTNAITIQEQIELLKTVKADKEDLEDALADKADAKAVKRKVSHDQFDATCDDLARGLEQAISKLSQQESIWQQSLDEIQREIGSKVDKVEISPLKELINTELKALQKKLKALTNMRQENEAAGTKKMLRDVQCLSCDKKVVMRMEENAQSHTSPMPCTKSIKPYLTYELDQIRKQQKKLPQGRNMLHFEAALQEARKMKEKEISPRKSSGDHLCNRYCGGSHTIVTPQQKVMRIGHFNNQWGPQVIQLSEGFIEGSDGQQYHGRPIANQVNGKKSEICEPCDNKCNIQRTSKENVASESSKVGQTAQKKASNLSVVSREKVTTKSSLESRESYEMKTKLKLSDDQPPPPPSSPSREPSLVEQSQNQTQPIGAGSFFEIDKPLAKVAFKDDDSDEIEEEEIEE